jgi:hypothetical protein
MARLLDQLGPGGRAAFRRALRIDGRMIVPGYSGLLVVSGLLSILPVSHASNETLEVLGISAALLAVLLALSAGVLDLVENNALDQVLAAWQDIPIPPRPAEAEAAERQERRRRQVAALDAPSRAVATAASRKVRCIVPVLVWLLVAIVVGVTDLVW